MSRGSYLALAAAACLTLCGCGGNKTNYKYRIAVIPKGLTHEFWQSIHRGADRAAADLGEQGLATEILWDGPSKESDATDQIKIIQTKSGMGIHGLVLAPQHSEQMVDPVKAVVDKGIPVVIIDSGLDPKALKERPDLIVKYVATNNYNGGRLAAKHLLEVLAKDGKTAPRLILLRYQVGSESTEQREQGFLDYVHEKIKEQEKAGKPLIRLVSTTEYAGATETEAAKVSKGLLPQFRNKVDRQKFDVDGIFTVNESATDGMLQALRSLDLTKDPERKVRLVGFDSSETLVQAIKDGELDGSIVQDPYRMGYLGVWVLVRHLEGFDVSEGGMELGTGEYVMTKENLDSKETRERFDAERQKERTIKVPEFKKKR
jgi:ribose transport system substrate-binding protein